MEAHLMARAVAAATSLAVTENLRVTDADVVHNSNMLAIRLLPCEVLARTALVGQEVAAFEVELAQQLARMTAPVAALDPRVEPRVYELDGFAVTFWTYYTAAADSVSPLDYAHALEHLHTAMQTVDMQVPSFTERVAAAERLLVQRNKTPALGDGDRRVVLDALRGAREAIVNRLVAEQLLHGEPHPGNLLSTSGGPRFIDLETCCRGPVEFDIAHVPNEVSLCYPDVDQTLLQECRRLVLAMVAAWRWDVHDQFPDGHRHGQNLVALLHAGPPWPTLGALSTG